MPFVVADYPSGDEPRLASALADGDESQLISSLRDGDQLAFERLVVRHSPGMLRVARMFTSDATAEDVVQDTWVAVVRGIEMFESRCSVQTWLYRILINRAKTSGQGERRTVPMGDVAPDGPTVDPRRFRAGSDADLEGGWSDPPHPWQRDPQNQAIGAELMAQLLAAIDRLPAAQRQVVTLRDVEGMSAAETAELLHLSAVNQRSLLHRGRARLRQSLEDYLALEGCGRSEEAR